MEDKDKLIEIINQTIPYFYPKDDFLDENKLSLEETLSKANNPTLRALNYLEYLVENTNFNYLNPNLNIQFNFNFINNKFYEKHKMKIDKIKELVYARMKDKENNTGMQDNETEAKVFLEKIETQLVNKRIKQTKNNNLNEFKENKNNSINLCCIESEKTLLESPDNVADYFSTKDRLDGKYEEMESTIKSIKEVEEIDPLINNFVFNEQEALNLIKIAKIHKNNPILYLSIYFVLANHISTEGFYYLEDLEEIIDLLEYYLFNNLINSNLCMFNSAIEVFKKIPTGHRKIVIKIINFLELILKNIYFINPKFKLKSFSVLLQYKDKLAILNTLIEEYEALDRQLINNVELRLYLIAKLFDSCVVNDSFLEDNYIKLTNQIFQFISVEPLIANMYDCHLSRIAMISCSVYFINLNFKENLIFFQKVFLKLNSILLQFDCENESEINYNNLIQKSRIMNISRSEEILYKNILKTNNLEDSLKLLFKQITFHFIKAMKNPKIIFKTNPKNLQLNGRERIKLINNLISKNNNLSYNLKYQLCEYLEELNYENVFDLLALIPTKKSFLKMLKFVHLEEKIPTIVQNYLNLLKERISIPNFIISAEIFDCLSNLIFLEFDKSIIKEIKIPVHFLHRIFNLPHAILLKHYSKYNSQEFNSLQNEIFLILVTEKMKIKKNADFYISIIHILTNILESKEIIYKAVSYLQGFIYYEKYCECIAQFFRKYYFVVFKEDSYYHIYVNSCLGVKVDLLIEKERGSTTMNNNGNNDGTTTIYDGTNNDGTTINNNSNNDNSPVLITSDLSNKNTLFIRKSIIQQIKNHQEVHLIRHLNTLLIEKDESFIADLLRLLTHCINNENIFEFISKNQKYFFNLFLQYKSTKLQYLNYKLIFLSTYLGAMLPKITLPLLVVHSLFNYDLLIKYYSKEIFELFDEIFNYLLFFNGINSPEKIINFILQNNLLYKLFNCIEPTKQRLSFLIALIECYEPIKCIYIYKNIIKCNLNNFERKCLIGRIKQVILLQEKESKEQVQLVYWMIQCVSALKGRKAVCLEEVSESEYERVRKIVDGYE